MKTLAIMGSGNGGNFETIVRHFENQSDVKITCLCNKADAFILERAKNLGIEYNFLPFEKNLEYFTENKFDLVALAGYMQILPKEVLAEIKKIINIHPSLLPSFAGSCNAIQDAYLSGVKVSGITIHEVISKVDCGKIIAQYPVFIESDMSLFDFEQAIHNIEHKLYPIVIEKYLEDKAFDFSELMKSSNKSNCSGNCSHSCNSGCCH